MQSFTFNTLDILLLLPIGYACYQGYKKGFTLELVSTFGFLLGLVGAIKFLDTFVQLASPMVKGNLKVVLPLIGFLVIFGMIWAISRIIGKWLSKVINHTLFGTADRAVGASLGFLKTFFVFGSLLWILNIAGIALPTDMTDNSMFYPMIDTLGPKTMGAASRFVPFLEDFRTHVESAL